MLGSFFSGVSSTAAAAAASSPVAIPLAGFRVSSSRSRCRNSQRLMLNWGMGWVGLGTGGGGAGTAEITALLVACVPKCLGHADGVSDRERTWTRWMCS